MAIGSIRASSVVVPRDGAYSLCAPDSACLAANARCKASVAKQQAALDAKFAKRLKEYGARKPCLSSQ